MQRKSNNIELGTGDAVWGLVSYFSYVPKLPTLLLRSIVSPLEDEEDERQKGCWSSFIHERYTWREEARDWLEFAVGWGRISSGTGTGTCELAFAVWTVPQDVVLWEHLKGIQHELGLAQWQKGNTTSGLWQHMQRLLRWGYAWCVWRGGRVQSWGLLGQ